MEIIYDTTGLDGWPTTLNFGCGSNIKENCVNVDVPRDPVNMHFTKADNSVLIEGWINSPQDLPKNYFTRIECNMVMEHIHPDLIPNLLYCFANFVSDKGCLVITVPHFLKLAQDLILLEEGELDWNLLDLYRYREINNEMLFPNMSNIGGHQSIWTERMATLWLAAEGFSLCQTKHDGYHTTFTSVYLGGDNAKSTLIDNT